MDLFYQPDIAHGVTNLSAEESRHALRVLRLKPGDPIQVTDGLGTLYQATVKNTGKENCEFSVDNTQKIPRRAFQIDIAVAPTKNIDRIEWFVEKAIEVGIEKISFIRCKHSERIHINSDRIRKIAVSAMKQSQQVWLPEISELTDFQKVLSGKADQRFICHAHANHSKTLATVVKKNSSYLALIGPEGDFTADELQLATDHGFEMVTLGPNRLRTETAALTACQFLNFINL